MDIATMTCKDRLDYNNVLQTYGMYTYLKKMGNQVQVIDYVPSAKNKLKLNLSDNTKKKEKVLNNFIEKDMITTFVKYKSMEELHDEPPLADAYVITNASNRDISLGFKGLSSDKKCISYATEEVDEKSLEVFKTTYDKVTSVFQTENEDVKRVVDPTFLLTNAEWYDFSAKSSLDIGESDYVLIYSDCITKDMIEYAKQLAKYKNSKIYAVCDKIENRFGVNKVFNAVKPNELVSLIQNTEDVITTLDEGIKFSCIFEKDLHIFLNNEKHNDKQIEMINEYNLVNRIINYSSGILTRKTNYEEANIKIDKLREDSHEVLNEMISK